MVADVVVLVGILVLVLLLVLVLIAVVEVAVEEEVLVAFFVEVLCCVADLVTAGEFPVSFLMPFGTSSLVFLVVLKFFVLGVCGTFTTIPEEEGGDDRGGIATIVARSALLIL